MMPHRSQDLKAGLNTGGGRGSGARIIPNPKLKLLDLWLALVRQVRN
jgi:hypothetical protein